MAELRLVTPPPDKMREAEKLLEMGFSVFPVWGVTIGRCDCGGRSGCSPGKHPHTMVSDGGHHNASNKSDDIDGWWSDDPNANIGIKCGGDLIILDVDGPEGESTLDRLEEELGILPPTLQVRTGKGRHLYFRKPTEITITNSKPKSWTYLDVRADSGYVIGPGSTHLNGATYQFVDESVPRAEIPTTWLKALQEKPPRVEKTTIGSQGSIHEGQRNEILYKKACAYRGDGFDGDALFETTNHYNSIHCVPPLEESEVRAICKSAERHDPNPLPVNTTKKSGDLESMSTTMSELSRMAFEEPKWIIAGLLPEGLTLLSAAPKVGKTWLAMDIALRVAVGGPVLGRFNVAEPRHVIFFGLEDNKRRFRSRMDKIRKGLEAPSNFLFLDKWDFGKAGRAEIVAAIKRNSTGLVVIDTLGCARLMSSDPIKKNVSPYQLDYGFIVEIKQMCEQAGVSILMLHHNRKQTDLTDPHSNVSGSQGILGGADTSWQLVPRNRGSQNFTMSVTGKDVPDASWALEWNKENYTWKYVGTSGEVFRNQTEQAILSVLGDEPVGPAEIARKTGINSNTVKTSLARLLERGYVTKNENGKYKSIDSLIR